MSNSQPELEKTPALWWYFFFVFSLVVGVARLTHAEAKPSFFSIQDEQASIQLRRLPPTAGTANLSCRDVPIAHNDRHNDRLTSKH